jgi:hypothetical protein
VHNTIKHYGPFYVVQKIPCLYLWTVHNKTPGYRNTATVCNATWHTQVSFCASRLVKIRAENGEANNLLARHVVFNPLTNLLYRQYNGVQLANDAGKRKTTSDSCTGESAS